MSLKVIVVQGSLLEADVPVIVNPANSLGLMGGGVAGVIKRAAGDTVEAQARRYAPIPVGQAVLTSGGKTKFQGIIHAPTMSAPGMLSSTHHVALATKAALTVADDHGFASVAIPGMGTGVGGVAHADAAKAMVEVVRTFVAHVLNTVVLVDVDARMVLAWQDALDAWPWDPGHVVLDGSVRP
jgi:O-acetyl-ADP-ribose deacetylase (regulator of RNase III)